MVGAAQEAQPTEKISVFASVLGGIDAQCASTDDEEQAEEQVGIAVYQVSGESDAQEQQSYRCEGDSEV